MKKLMTNILHVIGLLLISIIQATADSGVNNKLNIDGIAPRGIEALSTELNLHTDMPENKGPHGSREFCYQTDVYVVYSSNLLGHGYQLSRNNPKGFKCTKTKKAVKSSNKLGMHIGMTKAKVQELLNLKELKDDQTIIWLSWIDIKGKKYDLQTYVDMLFKKDSLELISAFTTTTR